MRYFFDTEFKVTEGLPVSIIPISIGLVSESGVRYYYAEFEGARKAAESTEWLRQNVLPGLRSGTGGCAGDPPELRGYIEANAGWWQPPQPAFAEKSPTQISSEIAEMIGEERPEFLASYGAYDWVVLCQAFGGLMKIPANWPWTFTELATANLPRVERVGKEHNSLGDAATLRKAWLAAQPSANAWKENAWARFRRRIAE